MNYRNLILFVFLLSAVVLTGKSQNHLDKVFYFKNPGGPTANRVILTATAMIYETYRSYNVDKPYWEVEKELSLKNKIKTDNGYQIIGEEGGKYFGGEYWLEDNGNQLYIFQLNQVGDGEQQIIDKLNNQKNKNFLARIAYSKVRLEEIEQLPSLDSLDKSGLITLLNHVYKQEELVANAGLEERIIWRIGHNILRIKFIAMGFDPDKPTDGYYMKRFIEDPDIAKLIARQVHFKTY